MSGVNWHLEAETARGWSIFFILSVYWSNTGQCYGGHITERSSFNPYTTTTGHATKQDAMRATLDLADAAIEELYRKEKACIAAAREDLV